MSNQSSTLSSVDRILRDFYLGPSRPKYRLEREWNCPDHSEPKYDRYEHRCRFDPDCDDWDCPHQYDYLVEEGCAECKKAEWKLVLDDEGEPIVHYESITSLQDQLSQELYFLKELEKEALKREAYADSDNGGS